jgi:hypothetical protein
MRVMVILRTATVSIDEGSWGFHSPMQSLIDVGCVAT